MVADGRLDPTLFATHRFGMYETMAAYDIFARAAETDALKVVLYADPIKLERAAGERSRVLATA